VFGALICRLRDAAAAIGGRVAARLRALCRPRGVSGGFLGDLTRSRAELLAENALLRQQLIVAARGVKRPVIRVHERGLLVVLASLYPRWRDALLLVKPETILRWHREGFRLLWRSRSKHPAKAKSRVAPEVIELIRRMARENRLYVKPPVMWSLMIGTNIAGCLDSLCFT
jgi:putative transposase